MFDEYCDTDEVSYGTMALTGDDEAWQHACSLVDTALGANNLKELLPVEGTTGCDTPAERCLYKLEHEAWSDKHPTYDTDITPLYRQPASHPEDDEWTNMMMDRIIRVVHEKEVYYVAELDEDACYLIIPAEVAKKSVRLAAMRPVIKEATHESANKGEVSLL